MLREWEQRTRQFATQEVWGLIDRLGIPISILDEAFGFEQYAQWVIEQVRPYLAEDLDRGSLSIRTGGEVFISGDAITILFDVSFLPYKIFGLQLLHPSLHEKPLRILGFDLKFQRTEEDDLCVQWVAIPSTEWRPIVIRFSSMYDPTPVYEKEVKIIDAFGLYRIELPEGLWPPSLILVVSTL